MTESECSTVFLFAKVTTIAVNMIFHGEGRTKQNLGNFCTMPTLRFTIQSFYFVFLAVSDS